MSISTYKILNDPIGGGIPVGVIATTDTGKILHIPFVEGNKDYQDYKLWLDAGNTPADAD